MGERGGKGRRDEGRKMARLKKNRYLKMVKSIIILKLQRGEYDLCHTRLCM